MACVSSIGDLAESNESNKAGGTGGNASGGGPSTGGVATGGGAGASSSDAGVGAGSGSGGAAGSAGLGGAPPGSGVIIHAATCGADDVQKAIDSASDGDRVSVPAGKCTWQKSVTVAADKGITLEGAGIDQTTIIHAAGDVNLLIVPIDEGKFTRITGFTFDQNNLDINGRAMLALIPSSINAFRVDHNSFVKIHERGIWVYAGQQTNAMGGLIDNNAFYCGLETGVCQSAAVDLCSNTEQSLMNLPLELGGPSFTFFEDNQLFYDKPQDGSLEGYGCARVVERFNVFNGAGFGHHGTDSGNQRGTQAYEYYHNTINAPLKASWSGRIAQLRSGNGFVFNNTFAATVTGGIQYYLYRGNWLTPAVDPIMAPPWAGNCDGKSAYDGNTGVGQSAYPAVGYPCVDSAGWTFNALAGQPGGSFVWGPNFVWGNRRGGALAVAATNNPLHQAENVDYFNEVESFDGSAGIGIGLRAKMDTITPTRKHVGFWVTDEGEWNSTNGATPDGRLYVWDGSKWQLFYTPFAYPHPLRATNP